MWDHYSVASKVNKGEGDVQVAALFTAIGPEARKVFKTWNLSPDKKKGISKVSQSGSTTTVTLGRIFPSSVIVLIHCSKNLVNLSIVM